MAGKRIIIIGGVAGGASAAARARRLSEEADIIVIERGPYVSLANCRLPYFVGGEIAAKKKLLVHTPESLRDRFNLDVRVLTEAVRIDRQAQQLELHDLTWGTSYRESYDALVLSTGAAPLKPPIPGIERPGHFTVRSISDADSIIGWIEDRPTRRAVVVGSGYIGREMVEQLRRRGLSVALAEALPQVMAPLDPEMAAWLHVDKRIDVFATALQAGMTVHDLAELELAYAPPFSAAKEPVNLAGMVAQNILAGDVNVMQWYDVADLDPHKSVLLDVRDDAERQQGYIPGSMHIPLPQLRLRLNELPRDHEIIPYCRSGQRSYYFYSVSM